MKEILNLKQLVSNVKKENKRSYFDLRLCMDEKKKMVVGDGNKGRSIVRPSPADNAEELDELSNHDGIVSTFRLVIPTFLVIVCGDSYCIIF